MDRYHGISREEAIRRKAANIARAAQLYAEIKSTPDAPKTQMELYKEIGKRMDAHPFSVLQWVQTAFRRKGDYVVPRTYIREGRTINGEKYLTPNEAAMVLGVSSHSIHNWAKYEQGPKWVVMKIDGKENLLYKEATLVAWKNAMAPHRDTRGRLHYYDPFGKPFLAPKNGAERPAIKASEVGAVGAAIAQAERTVRMGRKQVPVSKALKTLGASEENFVQVQPVPPQPDTTTTVTPPLTEERVARITKSVEKRISAQTEKRKPGRPKGSKNKPKVQEAPQAKRVYPKKRSKRIKVTLAMCLADARSVMQRVKRGKLDQKRYLRMSTYGRRYQRFYKGVGRNGFHEFLRDAMAEELAAREKLAKQEGARLAMEAAAIARKAVEERPTPSQPAPQPQPQRYERPHVEMLKRAMPNVSRPWWKFWR